MNKLFDTVLQTVKDRLPGISWKVGSLVRELLVEPLTYIGSAVDQVVADIKKTENIAEAIKDPVNNEQVLDVWMSRLKLKAADARKSTGEVSIVFTGTDPLIVPEATEFSWGDSVRVLSSSHIELDPLSSGVRVLGGGNYVAAIPVETADASGYTITAGTKLNWTNASNRVVDIYVSSAVTGGISGLTAVAKARMIDAVLGTASICGEQTTLNALIREFGESVCDVRFGDRKYIDGMLTVPLFIKQLNAPRTERVPLTNTDADIYNIGINQLVDIRQVVDDGGWIYSQFDVDYTSEDTATITVPGAGSKKLFADVLRFSDTGVVVDWLMAQQRGMLATLKALTPLYCEVSVSIPNIPELSTDAAAAVSEYINSIGFNAAIQDRDIVKILADHGVSAGTALTYTASVAYHGSFKRLSQTGGINLSVISGMYGVPVAIYCPVTKVKAV